MKESRDILSLFEALNSHEVFTPPRVARQMLDLLPTEIWSDPSIKILDPCTKSGVFLRESFYRLFTSLDGKGLYETENGEIYDLDDKKQRINHILKNMLFGIATSELTGYVARRTLYGVMRANSDKQISSLDAFMHSSNYHQWTEEEKSNFIGRNKFNEYFDHNLFCTPEYEGFEQEGNIFYPNNEVKKLVMEEDDYEIEDKYFPFIEENTKHKKILDIRGGVMKFDVVIGNPPYQKSDGGKTGATPLYHNFVEASMGLNPRYLCMIIPSRWFAGGRGLDKFRSAMMNDEQISKIVDFPKSRECFPGVDIAGGICYFLWEKGRKGSCEFTSVIDGKFTVKDRSLSEFDVIIRDNISIGIINKIKSISNENMSSTVLKVSPFGLRSFVRGESAATKNSVTVISSGGVGYIPKDSICKNKDLIDEYKVVIGYLNPDRAGVNNSSDGKSNVTTKVRVINPGEVVTETYIIPYTSSDPVLANNAAEYIKTKFCRFLILQTLSSMHITQSNFNFVPMQDFSTKVNDEMLYKKYNLSQEEIDYIESKIKPMGV